MQLLASPILWLLFGFFFLFRGSEPKGTDLSVFQDSDPEKPVSTTTTTTNGTVIKGVSISPAKAITIAGSLWKEFDEYITSESKIMSLLAPLNYSDFMLVYDKFGVHKQDMLANIGSVWLGSDKDLIQWIQDEVKDQKNLNQLSKQFPTIF